MILQDFHIFVKILLRLSKMIYSDIYLSHISIKIIIRSSDIFNTNTVLSDMKSIIGLRYIPILENDSLVFILLDISFVITEQRILTSKDVT